MRKTWFRFGLGSIIAAGAASAVLTVGCSSKTTTNNDDGGTPGNDASTPTPDGGTKDGSTTDSGTNKDSGTTPSDSGAKDSAVPTIVPAWISIVNASPDFGAMAICVSVELSSGAPLTTPAIAPLATIPPGAGGGLLYQGPPPTYSSFDLTTYPVTLWGVPAANVASGATCDKLVAADAGVGAAMVGVIAAKQLSHGGSYIVAITGCNAGDPGTLAGADSITGKCGAAYDGGSNLGLNIYPVDNATMIDGGIGVQVLQLSPQSEAYAKAISEGGYAAMGATALFNPEYVAQVRHTQDTDGGSSDSGATDGSASDDAASDAAASDDAASDGATADSGASDGNVADASDDTGPVSPFAANIPVSLTAFGSAPSPATAMGVSGLDTITSGSNYPGFGFFALLADGGTIANPASTPAGEPFAINLATLPYPSVILDDAGIVPSIEYTSGFNPGGANVVDGGTAFLASGNWTFILIGDPTAAGNPDAAVSQFGPRIIALPNNAQ